jgi:hypothetical protein
MNRFGRYIKAVQSAFAYGSSEGHELGQNAEAPAAAAGNGFKSKEFARCDKRLGKVAVKVGERRGKIALPEPLHRAKPDAGAAYAVKFSALVYAHPYLSMATEQRRKGVVRSISIPAHKIERPSLLRERAALF